MEKSNTTTPKRVITTAQNEHIATYDSDRGMSEYVVELDIGTSTTSTIININRPLKRLMYRKE